jgi:putative isomerase
MKSISLEQYPKNQDDVQRIRLLMQRGLQKERLSGRPYFTGYRYNTLYDWDQYFESIVQLYVGWGTGLIRSGVAIFLDTQHEDGFITRRVPGILPEERHTLDAQSQSILAEEDREMIKPFLSQLAWLVYRQDEDLSWVRPDMYQKLKKYIQYWLTQMDKNGNGLATWNSGPHSGMDDQVERLGRWGACISEGVDLNCFLARECQAFSLLAKTLGHHEDSAAYQSQAEALRGLIQRELWCEEDGFFYDRSEHTGEFIRVKSSAGFAPIWAGAATQEQSERLVGEHLLNPHEFWRAFPIPSYAASEPGYREARQPEDVGCNWRAQTWIPVNYYLMHGLMDYGYGDIARQIADKTYAMVKQIGDREYYNTDSCTGNGLDPFWGWSLLAYFMPLEVEEGLDPTMLLGNASDAM